MAEAEVEEAIIREYQESDRSIIRDRIVILGRQGAGKTVYLSLLYDLLWRSKGDLNMKALHGEHHRVPIVLVLTKVDHTRPLLKEHGGTDAFVRKFFPKLIMTTRNLRVCKVSAVQTTKERKSEIKPDFVPTNLEIPLRYCLDKISEVEENAEVTKRREENIRKIKREIKRDKIIGWCIAAVIAMAVAIVAYYVLTIIWPGILDKWIFG